MATSTSGFDIEEDDDNRLFISGMEKVGQSRNKYYQNQHKRKILIGVGSTLAVLAAIGVIIGLVFGLRQHGASFKCPPSFSKAKVDTVFFVVGDWGRQGSSTQLRVRDMMTDVATCMQPDFVVSTGDNFYESGLTGANDSNFYRSFSGVYTAQALQVPWYAVLGNHDYGDELSADDMANSACVAPSLQQCSKDCCYSPLWQVGPLNPQTGASNVASQQDSRWTLYQGVWKRSLLSGKLDLFFLDTPPFIARYRSEPWAALPGGISSQDPVALTARLQGLLANSTAPWKLLVGHHPVRSYGEHCGNPNGGDCLDMAWLRAPLAKYKVAAYLNGHEHDLQLVKDPSDPVYYVTSGAGSDLRTGEFNDLAPELRGNAPFLADSQGFVAVTITGDAMRLYFYTSQTSTPSYDITINRPT